MQTYLWASLTMKMIMRQKLQSRTRSQLWRIKLSCEAISTCSRRTSSRDGVICQIWTLFPSPSKEYEWKLLQKGWKNYNIFSILLIFGKNVKMEETIQRPERSGLKRSNEFSIHRLVSRRDGPNGHRRWAHRCLYRDHAGLYRMMNLQR